MRNIQDFVLANVKNLHGSPLLYRVRAALNLEFAKLSFSRRSEIHLKKHEGQEIYIL